MRILMTLFENALIKCKLLSKDVKNLRRFYWLEQNQNKKNLHKLKRIFKSHKLNVVILILEDSNYHCLCFHAVIKHIHALNAMI